MLYVKNGRVLTMAGKIFENGQVVIENRKIKAVGEKLSCTVSGQDGGRPGEKGADDEISYALLNALIGNAEFKKNAAGLVQTIAFEA